MIGYYKLQFLKFTASMITFGFTMITFSTWLIAFLNGDSVVITINSFGEMYFELCLWIILIPLIIIGTYYTYAGYMNCRKIWRKMILGKFSKEWIDWLT